MSNPTLQLIFAVCLGVALAACASQDRSLRVFALPVGDQQAFYQRGQPAVQASGPVGSVGLVLSRDKLLVLTLSLNNPGSQALLFEPQRVAVELGGRGTGAEPGQVFEYEQLIAEGSDAWTWEGASAATAVAGAAIPGAGWIKSAAQAGARIAIQEGKRQHSSSGELSRQALLADYLRLHTLTPGSKYQGYLQVELPRPPAAGDRLSVEVDFGGTAETFDFRFRN
jgi:hypothetical protein